jgi:hypothetical protein
MQCELRRRKGIGGRRTSQVHVRGHPGGKLGMLCCCVSSSPLGSTTLLHSHDYPLLRQPYALTASETPRLSPTFCLLHCPPLHCTVLCTHTHTLSLYLCVFSPLALWSRRRSTQQNLTLPTACSLTLIRRVLFLFSPSILSLVAKLKVLERQALHWHCYS